MTNPNNAVGTNGAYDGRTSVNAFNDNLAIYGSAGIISGWNVRPNSGLTLDIGGQTVRDVAVAEDAAGNRTTINNISASPISVTLSGAPASNKRIDLIVAYVENPPQGSSSAVDNPGACGLITVSSTVAANPTPPNDSDIRTAITADGAAGSTAYYVVLGSILIPSGTTVVDADMITQGTKAGVTASNVDFATLNFGNYSEAEVDTGFTWIDGKKVYKKTVDFGALPNATAGTKAHGIANLNHVINIEAIAFNGTRWLPLPAASPQTLGASIVISVDSTDIFIQTGTDRRNDNAYITLCYTKSS